MTLIWLHFWSLCLSVLIMCSDVSSIAEVILLCVIAIPVPLLWIQPFLDLSTRCKDDCVHALSLVPIALLPEQAHKVLYNKKHWIWGSYYSACWAYRLQCPGMWLSVVLYVDTKISFALKDGGSSFSGKLVVYWSSWHYILEDMK